VTAKLPELKEALVRGRNDRGVRGKAVVEAHGAAEKRDNFEKETP